jgi:thiosulfate dehydrogenase (quinone) large subunit
MATACSTVFLRIALAISFLSAVADRFGLWGAYGQPNVAWVEITQPATDPIHAVR